MGGKRTPVPVACDGAAMTGACSGPEHYAHSGAMASRKRPCPLQAQGLRRALKGLCRLESWEMSCCPPVKPLAPHQLVQRGTGSPQEQPRAEVELGQAGAPSLKVDLEKGGHGQGWPVGLIFRLWTPMS